MNLLERLDKVLQFLREENWAYANCLGGSVEYVEDPKNDNTFKNFIKNDCENYSRCAFVKGKWYFWPAKHAIHQDFVKSLGLLSSWNPNYRLEVQMSSSGLKLGYQIINDWAFKVYDEIKTIGKVTDSTRNMIKEGIALILDLHRKYGLKLDQKDLFKLKALVQGNKPDQKRYDSLYPEYTVDQAKISRKSDKHFDKSLPRKNRLSRIGWNYKFDHSLDGLSLEDIL